MLIPVLLALSCPDTKLINKTDLPWNPADVKVLNYCKKRCPELDKNDPCLVKFIKQGEHDYYCGCGPSVKAKN